MKYHVKYIEKMSLFARMQIYLNFSNPNILFEQVPKKIWSIEKKQASFVTQRWEHLNDLGLEKNKTK